MAELAHSKWSASGFEQKMLCPGSHVLQAGLPNSSSRYAAEGTAAHQVLTWALQEDKPAAHFISAVITTDGFSFEVDEDMARHVQVCIDYAKALAGDDGVILVDQRVNYSDYLGVPTDEAWGTLDVAVMRGDEITSLDFKYGMGVEVSSEMNPQIMLYALGILAAVQGLVGDFTRVRLAISQPRLSVKPSEYDLSVEELEAWGRSTARSAVGSCRNAASTVAAPMWDETFLRPGEKQCKFCKAKATCPALRDAVSETVACHAPATPEEFADLAVPSAEHIKPADAAWLSAALSKADLIEDWCKAVRAEVERRLLAGESVPGYKVVQGKRGNRSWTDPKAAEELLKSMRLKEAQLYDFSVKSPTQIAKLGPVYDKDGKLKPVKEGTPPPVIGPRQWPKVAALITQKDGAPHVAPVSDSRPALDIRPVAEDFAAVTDDLA